MSSCKVETNREYILKLLNKYDFDINFNYT